jgi:hypothetical protein
MSFIAIVALIAGPIESDATDSMTALEALAILEAAVLECKKRNVDTPEIREALDLLEPHIRPTG